VIRAVPDVNVFVSLATQKHGHAAQILARTGEFLSFTSERILADVLRVLRYDRIRRIHKMNDTEIVEIVQKLYKRNAKVPGHLEVKIVYEDPDDDLILACALEAEADYIISGDRHLLNLKHYRQIQIVTPAAFLDILNRQKGLKKS
jgi:hypothetical protein